MCHLPLPLGCVEPLDASECDRPREVRRTHLLGATPSGQAVGAAARADYLAVIISSCGTTGVPKGSWRSFAAYTALVNVPSPSDRRQLVNGQLAYLSQVLVDITLLGGGCVVLKSGYDAADTLATIESERITDLFLVEPQLFEVMDHPDVAASASGSRVLRSSRNTPWDLRGCTGGGG